jgi:hypothetical protein
MFCSPLGTNRRQGGIHLPMTEEDPGNEQREGQVEEEPSPGPPRYLRPPAAGTVTLESLVEIMQEIHTKFESLEARLDEHEVQLHHLNSNYFRTTSP